MSRTRYTFREKEAPHFMTCTAVNWMPLFSNTEHVKIVIDSLRWLHDNGCLLLYGYVIMENHLHLVAGSSELSKEIGRFKSFTARRIIDRLKSVGAESMLQQLEFSKLPHKHDRDYQFWQEGSHPQAIQDEDMMRQKLDYMHHNPVRRGYVDDPVHWRYSSARAYEGKQGLLNVCVTW